MNKKVFWIIVVLLIVIIAGLVYWNISQRQEMNEMVEQMTIEKEELEEEYEDLAIQFDGYQQMDIRNDSLQDLLSREQQRVQDLLEELRQTKASNARRISELKKELATVREVMKGYVRQIDSLNATNARQDGKSYPETAVRFCDCEEYHLYARTQGPLCPRHYAGRRPDGRRGIQTVCL